MGTLGVLGAGARDPITPRSNAASTPRRKRISHSSPRLGRSFAALRRPHASPRTAHAAPRTAYACAVRDRHEPKPCGGGVEAAEACLSALASRGPVICASPGGRPSALSGTRNSSHSCGSRRAGLGISSAEKGRGGSSQACGELGAGLSAGNGRGWGVFRDRFGVIITGFISAPSRTFNRLFPVALRFTSGARRRPEAVGGPRGEGREPGPGLQSRPARRGGAFHVSLWWWNSRSSSPERLRDTSVNSSSGNLEKINFEKTTSKKMKGRASFPGGPGAKGLPCNAGDTSSIRGPGRAHVPWSDHP